MTEKCTWYEWNNYKQSVQNVRDKIASEYKLLYRMLEVCNCKEKVPKITKSREYETHFDECVVCMKIHNVRTKINGKFKVRHTK